MQMSQLIADETSKKKNWVQCEILFLFCGFKAFWRQLKFPLDFG